MNETSILRETLLEEQERNLRAQAAYESEIAALPKGSVTIRSRGKREYAYLKFREGEKTKTQYVGPAETHEVELRAQVGRRKELEESLRHLKEEQRYLEKALRIR